MSETLSLFGLEVYGQGLFAALGCLALLFGFLAACLRRKILTRAASLTVLLGVPLGLVLGRALYCLLNLSVFTEEYENLWLMLFFWDGGLSLTGFLAGLLLGLVLAARITGESLSRMGDGAAAPLCLCLGLLHLGEQFTDLGVGKEVEESFLTETLSFLFLKEKMGVSYSLRPQVWLWEGIFCLMLAVVALVLTLGEGRKPGRGALLVLCLYGCGMIPLESLRDDGHMLLIFLRIEQLGAAACALIATGLLLRDGGRKLPCWLCVLLAIGGMVLLEFALDGRLAFGASDMGVNYLAMLGCCVLLALPSCVLFARREKP